MNADDQATTRTVCDECGHDVDKLWRRYKGKGFCAACYKRMFKRAICPKCGMVSRLYKGSKDAVCIKCEFAGVPCIRCKREEYPLGKITIYGPVCNACSVYFREKKQCDECGKLAYGVSLVSRLGGDKQLCPKCARADHGSCQGCSRHRLLGIADDGRRLCKRCLTIGEIFCPACGEKMPAGYGKECSSCYYRKLLHKRTEMNSVSIASERMSKMFVAFGQWLGGEVGVHKAANSINRYLGFFLTVERIVGDQSPEYGVLLKHFGTNGLRKHELPMRFLQQNGIVVVDETAKQEEVEQRRIESIMKTIKSGSKGSQILNLFHRHLMEKMEIGCTSLRSVRLALTPAARLLLVAQENKRASPEQQDLDIYLKRTPGQRAAISAFVRILSSKYGLKISLPQKDTRASRMRKQALEAELARILKGGGSGLLFRRRLIGTALAYFHGVPKALVNGSSLDNLEESPDGGGNIVCKGISYWLPIEVVRMFNTNMDPFIL